MADHFERTVSCSHCGAAASYAGMVGMPVNAIYQCNGCGRSTWMPGRPASEAAAQAPAQQQQQPQPSDPDEDVE